jgi:hypothetical protein
MRAWKTPENLADTNDRFLLSLFLSHYTTSLSRVFFGTKLALHSPSDVSTQQPPSAVYNLTHPDALPCPHTKDSLDFTCIRTNVFFFE